MSSPQQGSYSVTSGDVAAIALTCRSMAKLLLFVRQFPLSRLAPLLPDPLAPDRSSLRTLLYLGCRRDDETPLALSPQDLDVLCGLTALSELDSELDVQLPERRESLRKLLPRLAAGRLPHLQALIWRSSAADLDEEAAQFSCLNSLAQLTRLCLLRSYDTEDALNDSPVLSSAAIPALFCLTQLVSLCLSDHVVRSNVALLLLLGLPNLKHLGVYRLELTETLDLSKSGLETLGLHELGGSGLLCEAEHLLPVCLHVQMLLVGTGLIDWQLGQGGSSQAVTAAAVEVGAAGKAVAQLLGKAELDRIRPFQRAPWGLGPKAAIHTLRLGWDSPPSFPTAAVLSSLSEDGRSILGPRMGGIQNLILVNWALDEEGVCALRKAFPWLEALCLSGCHVTGGGWALLASLGLARLVLDSSLGSNGDLVGVIAFASAVRRAVVVEVAETAVSEVQLADVQRAVDVVRNLLGLEPCVSLISRQPVIFGEELL